MFPFARMSETDKVTAINNNCILCNLDLLKNKALRLNVLYKVLNLYKRVSSIFGSEVYKQIRKRIVIKLRWGRPLLLVDQMTLLRLYVGVWLWKIVERLQ